MYIGRDVDAISNVEKLDNITFDGGTTYALEKSSVAYTPSGANNILISVDGVMQYGNFTVSGTNIVFTGWSPTSSNTCDFILHIGVGLISTPADSSVTASKLGSLAVTGAKLNTDVISAQTALAAEPADTDEFMVSDAGVLKRIDYSLIKGGGKVLQAVTAIETANQTTTSTSWTQFGGTVDITPSATSSKVLVLVADNTVYHETSGGFNLTVYRDATNLGHSLYGYIYGYVNTHSTFSPIILDSPSTTSAVTYAVYGKVTSGTLYLNNADAHSSMTVLEIGA